MTLDPFEVREFGGLNLRDDPHDIGWSGATDGKNFTLENDGRLGSRSGTISFADFSCDSFQGPVAYTTVGGTDYLVAFCKTTSTNTCTLKYSTSGGTVSSAGGAWTGASAAPTIHSVAKFGDPDESLLIFTSRDGATRLQTKSWGGSGNVADIGVTTKPLYCAVTPNSNRLVLANFAAAGDVPAGSMGSPSTVVFSDAGATGFTATNYVHLTPGDGEFITGLATFRDFLFVFKETKFFVFYGEGTDETGNPVFNYRTLQIPQGAVTHSGHIDFQQICAGPGGVYFVAGQYVYRTDGGNPQLVSSDLGDSPGFSYPSLHTRDEYLYVVKDSTGADSSEMYVLNTASGWWTKWDMIGPGVAFAGFVVSRLAVGGAGDDDLVVKWSSSSVTDLVPSTSAIDFSYVTGKQTLSPPGTEGVLREVLFEGDASVFNASVEADGSVQSSAGLVASTASQGRLRKACRGRSFELTIEDNSGSEVGLEFSRVVGNVQPARRRGAS